MKVQTVKVGALIPYERNSRTHSPEQIAQLAASIREFGWTNPVLVDGEQRIIAGHGRLLAAKSLGMDEVPAIVLPNLTDAQRRALIIADNKLALNAGWDEELLRTELADLGGEGFDLSLLGFDMDELHALMADRREADPEDTPEPPADPVTRAGDVWLLGKHRIICGDSTDAETVAKCLNGAVPHLMVTDPPYGVEYAASWRDSALGGKAGGRATGKVVNDEKADWSEAWALFPGDVAYVWHAGNMAHTVADSLIANGLDIRAQIIWNKSTNGHQPGRLSSQA